MATQSSFAPIDQPMFKEGRMTAPWVLWFQQLTGQSSGGSGVSFGVVSVNGQDDVTATKSGDTLTLHEGPNIDLATNALAKSVDIAVDPAGDTWQVQFRNAAGLLDADNGFTYNKLLQAAGIGPDTVAGETGPVTTAGAVGITTVNVNAVLADTATQNNGLAVGVVFEPAVNSSNYNFATQTVMITRGDADIAGDQLGLYALFQHEGTGNMPEFGIAVEGDALTNGPGDIATMIGVNGVSGSYGSGAITNAICNGATLYREGSGTITNAIGYQYGGFGAPFAGTDVITNVYAFKAEDVTQGANNYAIYTGAGDIRFGHIAAPAAQTYAVTVNDAGVLSSSAISSTSALPIVVTTNTTVTTNNGWTIPESLEIAAGVILEIAGGARCEVIGSVVDNSVPLFAFTPPVNSQFAWTNQGTAFVRASNRTVYLQGPPTAADSLRIRQKSIPTTGTGTLTIAFTPVICDTTVTAGVGLVLQESGTGKVLIMRYVTSAAGPKLFVTYGTSATNLTTNPLNGAFVLSTAPIWQRVTTTSANYLFWISADGLNWISVLTLAKTTPFTTAADQWGFAVDTATTGFSAGMVVYSFLEN